MYNSTGIGSKRHRPTTGYLVRPRPPRSLYSSKPFSTFTSEKKKKTKKPNVSKMDFRKKPNYSDTAYREAVSRLRILLAESYVPMKRPLRELDSAGEETDNQSLISGASRTSRLGGRSYYNYYPPVTPRRYNYYTSTKSSLNLYPTEVEKTPLDSSKLEHSSIPPELMNFIGRQEDYIEQLEKESRFCKDELSSLLNKVKDVISENEYLHEKQKMNIMKSVFDHLETETETETETELNKKTGITPKNIRKSKILEGPIIVFESRISELEAQLTQERINLKKALEESDSYKRKIADGSLLDTFNSDTFKKQIDNLQREKAALQETVTKLQNTLSKIKDKENNSCDQLKRSLDVAEHAQYEKNAAENEIRRLKDELERQHGKLRDAIAEQSRRIADERSAVERRYTQQIEQLTTELGVQWETTNKLQLELDKQRRENADLRREVAQKTALIDEVKKETQNKILTLQSDIGVTGAEKSALEQQISTLQMINERNERQAKQENIRLQTEMQSLRQRLDRADADLIHSRRENIRLNEQIASLEKEINLNKALTDERTKRSGGSGEVIALLPPTSKKEDREKELTSMIQNMEAKHAATVAELEGMIHSQNQLMDKLSSECHVLTQKLEDSSTKHKEEIRELQTNLDHLSNKFTLSQITSSGVKDEEYNPDNNPRIAQPQIPKSELITRQKLPLSRTSSKASVKSIAASRKNSREYVQSPSLARQISQKDVNNSVQYKSDQYLTQQPEYYGEQQYTVDTNKQNTLQDTQQYQNYSTDPNKVSQQQYETTPNQQYDPNKYLSNQPQYMSQEEYNQQYLNQEYSDNPQYSVDSNQQYSADPNQQYSTDPNQQYSTDPNQQYSTDPNQQYSTDPNQQYSTDPNQQYSINPNESYTNSSNQQYANQQYSDDQNQLQAQRSNQQYTAYPDDDKHLEQQNKNNFNSTAKETSKDSK